jgi:hypothetical protein
MNNDVTTEVLAKAIDKTKDTVQKKNIGATVSLDLKSGEQSYQILNKAASDKDSQLNAMAIAPIVNGKPDYNNVAVVYAGAKVHNKTKQNEIHMYSWK